MEELSPEDWELLVLLNDDYHGTYAIPFVYFARILPGLMPGDEIPTEVRETLELKMSELYVNLFKRGLIDVFLLEQTSGAVTKLPEQEALVTLMDKQNYDYSAVPDRHLTVTTSDRGVELLDKFASQYRDVINEKTYKYTNSNR